MFPLEKKYIYYSSCHERFKIDFKYVSSGEEFSYCFTQKNWHLSSMYFTIYHIFYIHSFK